MSQWNSEKVKSLRKTLNLSQAEFAHKLGCRQQTVSEWEKGLYTPANAYGRLLEAMEACVRLNPHIEKSLKNKTPLFSEQSIVEKISSDLISAEIPYPEPKPFDPAVD